jgi:hypothetical protein
MSWACFFGNHRWRRYNAGNVVCERCPTVHYTCPYAGCGTHSVPADQWLSMLQGKSLKEISNG